MKVYKAPGISSFRIHLVEHTIKAAFRKGHEGWKGILKKEREPSSKALNQSFHGQEVEKK